jgi:2-methylisocitrate lyase-like PEP mutase family enzyme
LERGDEFETRGQGRRLRALHQVADAFVIPNPPGTRFRRACSARAAFRRWRLRAPATVAVTILLAVEAGLAGSSIEDSTGDDARPLFEDDAAVERVAAAAGAAREIVEQDTFGYADRILPTPDIAPLFRV